MAYPPKKSRKPEFISRQHHLPNDFYSKSGKYFVTVHVIKSGPALCTIESTTAEVSLTLEGKLVEEAIKVLPTCFPFVKIDCYVVMPTHIHAILILDKQEDIKPGAKPKTLGYIIGKMKTLASLTIRRSGCLDFGWQRDHYDRVIGSQQQLNTIRQYIRGNPKRWTQRPD